MAENAGHHISSTGKADNGRGAEAEEPPLDPSLIKLAAKLLAIEYSLTRLLASAASGTSDEQFEKILGDYSDGIDRHPMPGLDQAQSQLILPEVRAEVTRLLSAARSLRANGSPNP